MVKVCDGVCAKLLTALAVDHEEKEEEITTKLGNPDNRMVKVETTIDSNNNFSVVRFGMNPKLGRKDSETKTRNRFQFLKDETKNEIRLVLCKYKRFLDF